MSISMCDERRRAEREHDRVRLGGVGRARGHVERRRAPSSSSVPGSLNGIRCERTASRRSASLSIAEHAQPRVGERQRERQADPAEADDRDVVGHVQEASGAREALARPLAREADRRSAGCSAGSAATAGAAPGRAGTPTRARAAASSARRLRDQAGVEVERGADADQHAARRAGGACAPSTSPASGTPIPTHTTSAPRAADVGRRRPPPRRR